MYVSVYYYCYYYHCYLLYLFIYYYLDNKIFSLSFLN